MNNPYSAFSDESGIFDKRYQSIGVVSGNPKTLKKLDRDLWEILEEKNIKEVKFSAVRTHSPKIESANLFIEKSIEYIIKNKDMRIDILTWDTQDSRHNIPRRDDHKNLERMYFHLLRHISEKTAVLSWKFYPDKNSAVNWDEITSYLKETKVPRKKPNIIKLFEEERLRINFKEVKECESKRKPTVQLADLYCGMSRFCRRKGNECIEWLNYFKTRKQKTLFKSKKPMVTKTNKNRYNLVGKLKKLCKKHKLCVNLSKKAYLWTPNPNNRINFWNYEPQVDEDKAPTR
jgi:hypothetical protein